MIDGFKLKFEKLDLSQARKFPWILLLALALASRLAFILKTHIDFSSDEANCLGTALHYGNREWQARLYHVTRVLGGIRFWITAALYRCTNGWLLTGAVEAIMFNLAGCALWVGWLYRRLSPRASLIAALFLAIPPACVDYYGTLLERRQVSFVLGGVLAIGWDRWFSKPKYSLLLGLLLGWGFWEDPFILAFAMGLFLGSFWENRREEIWRLQVWRPIFWGLALSGIYGLFREWQEPQYPAGYLTYGIAGFSTILYRIHLLAEAFPQYWNDNMPSGYLQASSLGRSLDPMLPGTTAVLLKVWTAVLFASALAGYGWLFWNRPRERPLVVAAFIPIVLLLFFFLLSNHVSDALCFRYFTYWPVGIALGLGFLSEAMVPGRFRVLPMFLAFLILVQSAIFFRRIYNIPREHPAERIMAVLEDLGLRCGWANGWVTGAVNFISRDRICLDAYNLPPGDRRAIWLACHNPRIAVVLLEGLDQPGPVRKLLNTLMKMGYHPFARWNFKEGWSVLELRKGSARKAYSPRRVIGNGIR